MIGSGGCTMHQQDVGPLHSAKSTRCLRTKSGCPQGCPKSSSLAVPSGHRNLVLNGRTVLVAYDHRHTTHRPWPRIELHVRIECHQLSVWGQKRTISNALRHHFPCPLLALRDDCSTHPTPQYSEQVRGNISAHGTVARPPSI